MSPSRKRGKWAPKSLFIRPSYLNFFITIDLLNLGMADLL